MSDGAAMNNPYRLIMASAGSGKTYELTHAYVAVMRAARAAGRGDAVEKILASTFTRAAAGEIVERVLRLLAEAAASDEKRKEMSDHLGGEPVSRDEATALLEMLVRQLHRVRIGTLDSFLVKSAVAFAPELGIPANYRIAEGAEDKRLKLEAIERLLEAHVEPPAKKNAMLELMIHMNQAKWPREVSPKLLSEFEETYDTFLSGPRAAWEAIGPDGPPLSELEAAALVEKLRGVLPGMAPLNKDGTPKKTWVNAVGEVLDGAASRNWRGVANATLLQRILAGGAVEYSGAAMPRAFGEAIAALVTHVRRILLAELRASNIAMWALLNEFHGHYDAIKETRGVFQFGDFPRKLLEASVFEDADRGREELFFRLDSKIDHVMLDEFQDTSIDQWKVLQPLVEEILAGEGRESALPRTILCVGDVKQTLYAWRKAEPRLFGELAAKWRQLGIDPEQMTQSHRSSQVVIDAVNAVFMEIRTNPALQPRKDEHEYLAAAGRIWGDWFKKHETAHKNRQGFVRLRTCADKDDGEAGGIAALRLAADIARERFDKSPGEEIAILFRRKKNIPRILELLRARDIYAAGEGGSKLTDDPAVNAALSMLHLLDHPGDTAAVYHVANSPLGNVVGISDAINARELMRILAAIRTKLADIGIGGVLNQWLAGIAPQATARNCRRFAQLVAAAHQFDDATDIGGFVEMIREKGFEDVVAARVRVMTIHASKGRQFDTVILPDLDGDFVPRDPAILAARPHVLEPYDCISRFVPEKIRVLDPRLGELFQISYQQRVVEELCALYVAMTRAKFGLELIVQPRQPRKDGSAIFQTNMAGVLLGALTGKATAEQLQTLWEKKKGEVRIGDEEKQAALDEAEVKIAPGARRMRPTVTPSSLESGGMIKLGDRLSLEEGPSFVFGSLIHGFFELVEWLPAKIEDDALRAAGRKVGADDDQIDSAIRDFRAACGHGGVQKLFTRPAGNTDVWRERDFAVKIEVDGNRVTLEGRFDRVVVALEAGRPVAAEVVDFKTDNVTAEGALEKAVEMYRPQIGAYQRAVAEMLGLDISKVKGTLAFVISDVIASVDEPVPAAIPKAAVTMSPPPPAIPARRKNRGSAGQMDLFN